MSNVPEQTDPRASSTLVVFIILAILVLAFVVLAQVVFYNLQSVEEARKIVAVQPQELADLQARQLSQINSYRSVDAKAGVVAIPIDQAIELYAARMQTPWTPPKITTTETRPAETQPSGTKP